MNKAIFLSITIIVLLLSACTESPGSIYAKEMSPAVNDLMEWQSNYLNLESNLVSVAAVFEFYGIWAYYEGGFAESEERLHEEFPMLVDLIQPADAITQKGQEIINVIGVVSPPAEIQVAHNQILACIRARIEFTETFSSSLSNTQPIDFSEFDFVSTFPYFTACDTFDAALSKVSTYIEENK